MNPNWMIAAVAAAMLAAGCAAKKGFEQPGFAFGCPIGEAKVASMDDLVKAKVVSEGRRTTIQADRDALLEDPATCCGSTPT